MIDGADFHFNQWVNARMPERDLEHLLALYRELIQDRFEYFDARFADPDLVRNHNRVEVRIQAIVFEDRASRDRMAEVRTKTELNPLCERAQQTQMMQRHRDLLA